MKHLSCLEDECFCSSNDQFVGEKTTARATIGITAQCQLPLRVGLRETVHEYEYKSMIPPLMNNTPFYFGWDIKHLESIFLSLMKNLEWQISQTSVGAPRQSLVSNLDVWKVSAMEKGRIPFAVRAESQEALPFKDMFIPSYLLLLLENESVEEAAPEK